MIPLLWCDVETLGLDPEDNYLLLSIALVATDEQLEIQDMIEVFFSYTDTEINERSHPKALVMHQKSGLLKKCQEAGVELAVGVGQLVHWVKERGYERRYMGGANPCFDRGWLRKWAPGLLELFHYRSFDVNSIVAWEGMDKDSLVPPETKHHWALNDLERDIELVKSLRDQPPKGVKAERVL